MDYEFEWHCKVKKEKEGRAKEAEKDDFVTDRPWKAARTIISKGSAGLVLILAGALFYGTVTFRKFTSV